MESLGWNPSFVPSFIPFLSSFFFAVTLSRFCPSCTLAAPQREERENEGLSLSSKIPKKQIMGFGKEEKRERELLLDEVHVREID